MIHSELTEEQKKAIIKRYERGDDTPGALAYEKEKLCDKGITFLNIYLAILNDKKFREKVLEAAQKHPKSNTRWEHTSTEKKKWLVRVFWELYSRGYYQKQIEQIPEMPTPLQAHKRAMLDRSLQEVRKAAQVAAAHRQMDEADAISNDSPESREAIQWNRAKMALKTTTAKILKGQDGSTARDDESEMSQNIDSGHNLYAAMNMPIANDGKNERDEDAPPPNNVVDIKDGTTA